MLLDVMEIEAFNGLICKITGLAPNIDEPLVGARLTTKKKLEIGNVQISGRAARNASLQQTLHKCIASYKSPTYNAILDNSKRWLRSKVSNPERIDLLTCIGVLVVIAL